MLSASGRQYEVIFDPIGKTAILRADDDLIWLDGPFRNYQEAEDAARIRLKEGDSTDRDRRH